MARDERTGVAFHESGHAVAATVLGGRVGPITLEPAMTRFTMPRAASRRDKMVTYLAGLVAESAKLRAPKVLERRNATILRAVVNRNAEGLTVDETEVYKLLGGLDPTEATRQLLDADQAARRLVRDHWTDIEVLAAKLVGIGSALVPSRTPQRRAYGIQKLAGVMGMIVAAIAVVVLLGSLSGSPPAQKPQIVKASMATLLHGTNPCAPARPTNATRAYGESYITCSDNVTVRP